MYAPRFQFHLDMPLLGGLLLVSAVGLVVLYSASDKSLDMVLAQTTRLGMGFGVLLVVAQLPTQRLLHWIPWAYLGGILLLIVVLLVGSVGKGAQRWLDIGFMRFQPAEIMKIIVPLMLAWYLADKPLPPSRLRLAVALLLVLVPFLLIAKQPDLGTALLIASSGIFVILLSGISWRFIINTGLIVAVGIGVLVYTPILKYALHPYQLKRIEVFLNPEEEPLGAGYHIIQSKIAIGSGGLYGKGWLNGTQSHLEFLPERHTDFIFAVLSEEFGLIGVLMLLSLYLFVLTRGLYIAASAQGTFDRLVAGAISLTFFVYFFVNIGMVTGTLPVVGIPLPLISYGGTSAVTLLTSFGLLMTIHTHKRLLSGQL